MLGREIFCDREHSRSWQLNYIKNKNIIDSLKDNTLYFYHCHNSHVGSSRARFSSARRRASAFY